MEQIFGDYCLSIELNVNYMSVFLSIIYGLLTTALAALLFVFIPVFFTELFKKK